MRRWRRVMGVAMFAVLLALPGSAWAQGAIDATRIEANTALTGEPLTLTLEVVTPAGATVELDPANESWAGVEIVRIASATAREAGDSTIHTLELVVAGFAPGATTFQPAVFVIAGTETSSRLLPAAEFAVIPTLSPGEPLEISPIPPPVGIEGAESPLLWPAVAAGALAGVGLTGLAATRVTRRLRRTQPQPQATPVPVAVTLDDAEALIERDPVGAYRALSGTVRDALGERYGFPARALTTREMDRRMQAAGIDRWRARLVTGLLEECDAVVYAGYRPAMERRAADLTMAREIVEAG